MSLTLYGHPFSSYCQKVFIALDLNETPFDLRILEDKVALAEFSALWPLKRMPALVDGDKTVVESTVIIEYLDVHHRGRVRLVPEDPAAALDVRMLDRFFDNYIMTPMQKIVLNQLRPVEVRDGYGVEEARGMLDTAYGWLEAHLKGRSWAAGGDFTLADCAAAPSLFYADWAHEIAPHFAQVRAYRARLLQHPAVKQAVDGGRPYRSYFPLGAPDRD
ncbi:MAG: glutathione S-transferase [Rhizobiales bacterium 62-17]|nr:glutathione S-transferase family protein [Hyphomicrobiales bacterium]OJY02714.1 MAG: glutathione S-transferase [Rhizobiales bacterium 62-17]